jgi:hypothetical protein
MNTDQESLEAELRELLAAPLDDAFLSRLEAAVDGTLTSISPEESRFEARLRGISPTGLAPDFLASLETIVSGVPFPVDEKIVLFPKAGAARPQQSKRPMWSAAAAVALIGAMTALLVPAGGPANTVASQPVTKPTPSTNLPTENLIPAGFNRGVSNVHDEGVVWKSNSQPHTLMRVEYIDRITMKDKDGREYQVEQPRTRYMLVPAKTD